MVYLVLGAIGVITFIVVRIYQLILSSKKPLLVKLLLFSAVTFIIMLLAYFRVQAVEEGSVEMTILSPIASPINKGVATIHYVTKSKGLETVVQGIIKGQSGTYAIGIKNFKTGEDYFYNEERTFSTASIYKLWIMATVFKFIDEGKLTPEKQLSQSATTLNSAFGIDEESAEIKEGAISYTVKEALEQMITISHNYAAYLLTYAVKITPVKNYIHELGMTNSNTGDPSYTTVKDTALFYEKLYKGEVVNPTASKEMLEILRRQKINDRIPKYLPTDIESAHKTGELGQVKHDAGIVFAPNGDYIIVLFSETADQTTAAEVEANISKAVWNYFQKK